MKKEIKVIMKRLEEYSRFFRFHKPDAGTVFRTYQLAMAQMSIIIERINENPYHPENDHKEEILNDIEEAFVELERLKMVL